MMINTISYPQDKSSMFNQIKYTIIFKIWNRIGNRFQCAAVKVNDTH